MIASYAWDFGDGRSATGATTAVTYTQVGSHIVTLTVTDDDGATASTTQTIVVDPPPVVTDRVSLQASGARTYLFDGRVTTGNLRVVRDAFGISRVTGTATYPGVNGGTATVRFTLSRFFIFNAFTGQVRIEDPSAAGMSGLSTDALLSSLSSPSATSARGTLRGTVGGKSYTLRFTVDDRA